MEIKILYDKEAKESSFACGWGFSCVIDKKIMFDTGPQPYSILLNMQKSGISPQDLESIIISHEHWDHIDGLWEILARNPKTRVFVCPAFSREFKDRISRIAPGLVETGKPVKLDEHIFISEALAGIYKGSEVAEQSLVLKTENGLSVITGCAHPGIIKILDQIQAHFRNDPFYAVIGGFHLLNMNKPEIDSVIDGFKRLKVKKAGPSHCTGELAEQLFKEEYKNNFISIRAGDSILI